MGLPTTLMVAALVLTMGFTVVAVGFNHLSVSSRLSNAQDAYNLAEAAVARTIEMVVDDVTYGTASNPGVPVTVSFDKAAQSGFVLASPDQGSAQVTFDTGEPYYSTNNLGSDAQVTGWNGRIVPAEALHVVGLARCNGVERCVEAMLHVPRFPYVIASSGPIVTNGGLFVAGVKDPSVLDTPGPIPEDQLLPGHLLTNATGAGDDALKLDGDDNRITGDVQSASGVTLGTSQVEGEVRTYADPVDIPDLDITSYDTAGKPDVDTTLSSAESGLTVSGYARRDGSMIVTNGLTLNNGVLYVDGNLTVHDGISGRGAVIVNGQTQVFGGGSAASDNVAALLSAGDVTIQGVSGSPARFEGLIYTEGDLSSDYMQLVGVFLANESGAGSTMSLDNTELIYDPSHSEINVEGTGTTLPVTSDSVFNSTAAGVALSASTNVAAITDYDDFYDATLDEFVFRYPDDVYASSPSSFSRYVFNPVTGYGEPVASPGGYYNVLDMTYVPITFNGVEYTDKAALRQAVLDYVEANTAPANLPLDALAMTRIDRFVNQCNHGVAKNTSALYANSPPGTFVLGGSTSTGGGETLFSVNLSDFTELLTEMRVLYWTEYKTP